MFFTLNPLKPLGRKYPWIYQYRFDAGLIFGSYFLLGVLFALQPVDNVNSFIWKMICGFICVYSYTFFAFLINDLFDAPYDALDPRKSKRNLFLNKYKEKRLIPYLIFLTSILIALGTACILGPIALGVTVIGLFMGLYYSSPPIRAKNRPGLDLFFHATAFGGNILVLGYLVWQSGDLLLLILYLYACLDSIWIEMNNQIRDYEIDKAGGQTTTFTWLGYEKGIILHRLVIFLIILSLGVGIGINLESLDPQDDFIIFWPAVLGVSISFLVSLIFLVYSKRFTRLKQFTRVRNYTVHPLFGLLFLVEVIPRFFST
ncbi:MAG: UbiA family prenyltransferase [Candidatus Hodarchaeota archaeon]